MCSEKEAIAELMNMSDEELLLVDFKKMKWVCSGKNCSRGTSIRDYGIHPIYFHPRKSIRFIDLNTNFWMCEKHFKAFKILIKNYSKEHVGRVLFNHDKLRLINV